MALIYKDGQFYDSAKKPVSQSQGNADLYYNDYLNAGSSPQDAWNMAYGGMNPQATGDDNPIVGSAPNSQDPLYANLLANNGSIPQAPASVQPTPAYVPPVQTTVPNTGTTVPNSGTPDYSALYSLLNQQPDNTPVATVQPQSSGIDMATILAAIQSGQTPVQGSQEPFLPSSSTGELSQALQNRGVELLNRQYGYTPEEEAMIWQRMTEQGYRDLENAGQQYGWNQGAGVGGQGRSAFQDYTADMASSMAINAAEKRAADEQSAINSALGINDQLYQQTRGDFSDMLSLMQFDQNASAQQFNQTMQSLGFVTDQQQQEFLNKQGISDREIESYRWQREYEDTLAKTNLDYLQAATGNSPDAILNALSWAGSNEASVLGQGVETPDSQLANMLTTFMHNQQGNGSQNTGTVGGKIQVAQDIYDSLPDNVKDYFGVGAGAAGAAGTTGAATGIAGTMASILPWAIAGGLAAYGAYKGISKLTEGGETNGNHGRRLAEEYYGKMDPVVSYVNWKLLETDKNSSESHERSNAIRYVDLGLKQATESGKTGEEAIAIAENYARNWLTKKYIDTKKSGWSPALVDAYVGTIRSTYEAANQGDPDILYF